MMPPPQPPPMGGKNEDNPDFDDRPDEEVQGLLKKIKSLGIADYLFAIGAGIAAFRSARSQRKNKKHPEERDI